MKAYTPKDCYKASSFYCPKPTVMSKKIYIILTLSIFNIISIVAQTPIQVQSMAFSNEAGRLFYSKEYEKAALTFDTLFSLLENAPERLTRPSGHDYYKAACSWLELGDTLKSAEYMRAAVDFGISIHDIEKYQFDSTLVNMKKTKFWNDLHKILLEKDAKYGKAKRLLESLKHKDQVLRSTVGCVIDLYGVNSPELIYYKSLLEKEDSINQQEVIKILDEHGWLEKNQIGKKASSALWLVIVHGDLELKKKYLPNIKNSVEKGYLRGSNYAFMIDKILLEEGKKQRFGSQILKNPDGSATLLPLEDGYLVNERRAKLNMQPLEEYINTYFDENWKPDFIIKK